jgi:hypothetical protein
LTPVGSSDYTKITTTENDMTCLEWKEHNVHYVLLNDNGDIYAEVTLPNTYTLEAREAIMGTMAASTYTKWSEATEYDYAS